jgi:hypothetical protein
MKYVSTPSWTLQGEFTRFATIFSLSQFNAENRLTVPRLAGVVSGSRADVVPSGCISPQPTNSVQEAHR